MLACHDGTSMPCSTMSSGHPRLLMVAQWSSPLKDSCCSSMCMHRAEVPVSISLWDDLSYSIV
eukprot:1157900-Pelagomonas_calceolata.AAC.13